MNYSIETDKFHRIIFKKYYVFKLNPKNTTLINVLSTYLSLGCMDYPNEADFSKYLAKAYNLKFNVTPSMVGKYKTLCFTLRATDPKYINDDNYTLDFLNEVFEKCLQPVIVSDNFDKHLFEKAYEIVQTNLLYREDYYDKIAKINAIHEVFKGTERDFEYFDTLEALSKITRKKLYNEYQKIITAQNISYVCGNDVSKLNADSKPNMSVINNYFFKKRNDYVPYKSDPNDKEQAYLNVIYDLKSFSDSPLFYSYAFINYAFGVACDSQLFTIVREKYGLCYIIYSEHMGASGIIMVTMYTDKPKVKMALEKIDEAFDSLLDNIDIEQIRDYYLTSTLSKADNQENGISEKFFPTYFGAYNSQEEEIRKIKEVTKESIVKAYKKMKKSFTYVYGGVDNE